MPGMAIPAAAMKRGTPRIVPVVVSAGLAVGVFCGLYYGLGTGKETEADTGTTTAPTGPQAAAGATDEVPNFKSAPPDPSTIAKGSGSADGSAAGSADVAETDVGSAAAAAGAGAGAPPAAGSGATPEPATTTVALTLKVAPADAEVTLDGEPVTGGKATISFTGDKKTVRLVAKASGHRSYDKKITVTKDSAEEAIEIKLSKRSSGSPRPPGGGRDRDPPGGLIDL
jgi:hypothetical protein